MSIILFPGGIIFIVFKNNLVVFLNSWYLNLYIIYFCLYNWYLSLKNSFSLTKSIVLTLLLTLLFILFLYSFSKLYSLFFSLSLLSKKSNSSWSIILSALPLLKFLIISSLDNCFSLCFILSIDITVFNWFISLSFKLNSLFILISLEFFDFMSLFFCDS